MKKTEILYEPLPIARIGVRKDNDEVVVVKDFSCFAQMLEEYICLGTIGIAMPKSCPEVSVIKQMPMMLQKRISIINDDKEVEIVNRLLHNLRLEFGVKINEETNYLSFKKGTKKSLILDIEQIHYDIKRFALGFNHQLQVPVNIDRTKNAINDLRKIVTNTNSRLILAETEGLLNQYKKLEYDAVYASATEVPYELMNTFDKLINDPDYIGYSEAIYDLSIPSQRDKALLKIKELVRIIQSKKYVAKGWDHIIKIVNVWAGNLIPDSKAIGSIITSNQLPTLVDLEPARKNAIELWKNLKLTDRPLRRDGLPYANENISWMPPTTSLDFHGPDSSLMSLGKAGELLKVLNKFVEDGKK